MDTDNLNQNLQQPEKVWRSLLGTGIFIILLGLAAIFLPTAATLTIEFILAVVFIFAGVGSILHAFHSRFSRGLVMRLVAGILYLAAGIIFLAFPFKGALALTVFLAVIFIFSGAFKIALALHIRPAQNWGWLLFSGIISAILGIIIWIGLPGNKDWVLGLLVGIELLFSGWAMSMFALTMKEKA